MWPAALRYYIGSNYNIGPDMVFNNSVAGDYTGKLKVYRHDAVSPNCAG